MAPFSDMCCLCGYVRLAQEHNSYHQSNVFCKSCLHIALAEHPEHLNRWLATSTPGVLVWEVEDEWPSGKEGLVNRIDSLRAE